MSFLRPQKRVAFLPVALAAAFVKKSIADMETLLAHDPTARAKPAPMP